MNSLPHMATALDHHSHGLPIASDDGVQVTVTGGTGFIAGALIQQLLEKGYNVNATVRSVAPTNPKTQHLLLLAAAFPGDLHLFEADLLVPGAFDAAVEGSSYVFHVASPVLFEVSLVMHGHGFAGTFKAVSGVPSTVRYTRLAPLSIFAL